MLYYKPMTIRSPDAVLDDRLSLGLYICGVMKVREPRVKVVASTAFVDAVYNTKSVYTSTSKWMWDLQPRVPSPLAKRHEH